MQAAGMVQALQDKTFPANDRTTNLMFQYGSVALPWLFH